MKTDLERQVRDYVGHAEATVELIVVDEVARNALDRHARSEARRRRDGLLQAPTTRRGWAVAAAAALATVVAVGGAVWIARSGADRDVADIPAPDGVSEATVPVTEAPAVPRLGEDAPSDAVPSPESTKSVEPITPTVGSAEPAIDFLDVASVAAETDTPIGTVTWLTTKRVPVGWFVDGFPSSKYGKPREVRNVEANAPWKMIIQETPGGYIGYGWADEDHLDPYPDCVANPPCDPRWEPMWYGWVFPSSISFSTDGVSWELMSESPFEPGTAVIADPFVLDERDGRFVLVGWAGAGEHLVDLGGGEFAALDHGTPSAWISDDLRTWTRVDYDFDKPGMRTWLTSVVATESGWAIFGARADSDQPEVGSRSAEWAAWLSADGIIWEEFAIGGLLSPPECTPWADEHCARIKATAYDGSIVAYAWQWAGVSDGDFGQRFELLIGLPAESSRD